MVCICALFIWCHNNTKGQRERGACLIGAKFKMWEVLHNIKLVGVMEKRKGLEIWQNQDNISISPKSFFLITLLTGLEMQVCGQVYLGMYSGAPVWEWGQQDWREWRVWVELWCREDRGPSPADPTWSSSDSPQTETREPAFYILSTSHWISWPMAVRLDQGNC